MQSLVSIIIPAYNAERFISQTLDSVLHQTYSRFEVIVVDDGSRDRTAEIVRSYAQRDSRIKLIQQENAGVVAARNLAIRQAQGAYIAPLDADDIWYPQKLEKQVQRLEAADPAVGLVYCWSVYLDGNGTVIGKYPAHQLCHPEGEVLTVLIFSNFLDHASNPLVRRSCIDHVGGYVSHVGDQNIEGCADWNFYLRLAEHYRFAIVPEYLIGYRQASSNNMSANCVRMEQNYNAVLADIRERHPEVPIAVQNWARSSFYNYLLGRSYVNGDYRNALVWLIKGVSTDPILLLRPGIYQALVVSSLQLLAQPFVQLLFKPELRPASQSEGEPDSSEGEPRSEDRAVELYPPIPEAPEKQVRRPYDTMYLRRWQTVMRINQRLAQQRLLSVQTES